MKKLKTTKDWAITITLCIIGLVTALPVLAVITPEQTLQVSYGITITEPMSLALVQHRGIFQFMLGAGIIAAAFYRSYRIPIAVTALITKGSFTLMILTNPVIRDNWPTWVAIFDITSIIILCLVAIQEMHRKKFN